ncbi:MAG: hypothetical protein WC901_06655 [Candidatus Margulisiibacteriota bacterium]
MDKYQELINTIKHTRAPADYDSMYARLMQNIHRSPRPVWRLGWGMAAAFLCLGLVFGYGIFSGNAPGANNLMAYINANGGGSESVVMEYVRAD